MYQNYIFDFYGTLANIQTDEESPYLWKKLSEIYTALGACYQPEELKQEFRRLEQEEVAKFVEKYAEADLKKVFALLYHKKGTLCDVSLAKTTAVVFRALSREYLRLYCGVEELLQELKKHGKGIYLLSNAQADFTRPEIQMLGLENWFHGICLSSEQKCKKPSPAFFQSLLVNFDLEPSTCIMIGNDEVTDIVGAQQVGMDSLYIHSNLSPEWKGIGNPTYLVMDGNIRKIKDLIISK